MLRTAYRSVDLRSTPRQPLQCRKLYSWTNDLFDYTGGRFLFNEDRRRTERQLKFNVDALATVISSSVNRPVTQLASITKLAEGGFNRILQATFNDGYAVLARLPFNLDSQTQYAVASEAATLTFLRHHGVPVPNVFGYSASKTNPVGIEYLILDKMNGTPLAERWYNMDLKALVKVMRQIVKLERQFLSIQLPAYGSLYHRRDITMSTPSLLVQPLSMSGYTRSVAALNVDKGPWTDFRACFEAPAKRELKFCEEYGKPRYHVERYLREVYELRQMSPTAHAQVLRDFLKLAPHLVLPPEHPFSRPMLRHPDFSPSNILVSDSDEIVGIIDWQHAVVLPLCLCAGIPRHYQNWGDPLSEKLAKPETRLPVGFDALEPAEQDAVRTTTRRRLVHFYYAAMSMRESPDHFEALRNENSMLRAKLFDRAGAPWEGDTVSLKHAIIQALSKWPLSLAAGPSETCPQEVELRSLQLPVRYTEDEVKECLDIHAQESEKMQELEEMRELLNVDALGWIPDVEQLEKSKRLAQSIKVGLLEHSTSDTERIAIMQHFPFDDHDEES